MFTQRPHARRCCEGNANKHLPDVHSAKEMVENGLDVTQINALLLTKIEELTLFVITLEQKMKKQ